MVFRERGYLASDAGRWTRKVRVSHTPRFELADRTSSLGQRVVPLFQGRPPENQILLSGALFLRGLQSLQGAILMAERGMTLEAGTLTRSCYETLFYLGCSVRDVEFSKRIALDHLARVETLFNVLRPTADADDIKAMDAALAEAKKQAGANRGTALIMEQVARDAGMGEMYGAFYRGLSTDAAHPTVMSLFSVWLFDNGGNIGGWRWGPASFDADKLGWLLMLMSLAGICLIEQTNTLLKNDEVRVQLEEIAKAYHTLQSAELLGVI
jgi:hypothetical protein